MSRNPTLAAASQGGSETATGMSTDSLPKYTLVVVGDGAVGKSAITLQFLQHIFVEDYDPTIEDSYVKTIQIDGQWCVLDIFDTAGEDDFTAMRERYMRRGDGFLLVYSVTDPKSFSHVTKFYNQILRVKDQERYPVMLVGNKIDLQNMRSVSQADGIKLGQDLQIPYIETSAKTPAVNVDEAFHTIVRLIRVTHNEANSDAKGGNDHQQTNPSSSSRLPVKESKKGLCNQCSVM